MNDNIKAQVNHYKNLKILEQTKVREVLQQTALLGLERHGFFEQAAFYGGTALRILYGLDRFSEDLDFTLLAPNPNFNFTPFLEGMKKELAAFGYGLEVEQKNKSVETSIVSAFLKINTLQLFLTFENQKRPKFINPEEKIKIKLEVDIDPPQGFRKENKLVINPFNFYVLTLNISDLFAGKMHALLYRSWKGRIKGRDWYDLIWYVQKQIPLSLNYFESCSRQAGHLKEGESINRDKLLDLLRKRISQIDWEDAKADVRPFVLDPEQQKIWSATFFNQLIEHISVE